MDEKIEILHAADFHLGVRPPASMPSDLAVRYREERLKVFIETMDLARRRGADIVVIAGDLLENEHVRRQTMRRVAEVFADMVPAYVLIAPGNHDPFQSNCYLASYEWPPNVHVFPPGWSQWQPKDLPCVVSGFGWERAEYTEPLLGRCPAASQRGAHLVVIHGDVLAPGGQSRYLPITRDQLQACGADYVALGHVHQAVPATEGSLQQHWMNPGTPEPMNFGEGEKLRGVVVGSVAEGKCELELMPLEPKREYRQREIDVSGADGGAQVAEALRALPLHQRNKDIFRATLMGEIPPEVRLNLEEIRVLLSEEFYHLELFDETRAAYDVESISCQEGLRGRFAAVMLEKIGREQDPHRNELLQRALRAGLDSFAGLDINRGVLQR